MVVEREGSQELNQLLKATIEIFSGVLPKPALNLQCAQDDNELSNFYKSDNTSLYLPTGSLLENSP